MCATICGIETCNALSQSPNAALRRGCVVARACAVRRVEARGAVGGVGPRWAEAAALHREAPDGVVLVGSARRRRHCSMGHEDRA